MRNTYNFNSDWLFFKTSEVPSFVPDGWERVDLPHTWNALDGQDGGNDYWRGTAMYCKAFARPDMETNSKVFLEINGAANIADVYLNGNKLNHHEGGYSTFLTDMTDFLEADNLLCVAVDNAENDYVYPQKADFTFYGGLYRDVNLICVPVRHFTDIHVTPIIKGSHAVVTVETHQSDGMVTMEVAGQTRTVLSENGYARAEFIIENVHLWDGIRDPYLYTATAKLEEDEISTRFGCRTIEFSAERGFLLNGRSYPLRGVSRHQDREGLGNALTLKEHQEDMSFIREIGANTVRLAHYQHAREFYDLCDENGIIVWAEIPYITQHMPKGRANTLSQMRELITQCYNHPSIVCWGLSNEITVNGMSEDLLENHRELNSLGHKLDSTRPTTMAHAFMLEKDNPLIEIADIGSYNLYFGWYLGTLEQNDAFFDDYHTKYPTRVMGFSEYGADANPAFQSADPEQGDYSETFQCVYHEHILRLIENRPWLWATHLWNLFDFAADGREEGGKKGINQKGLISFDRKLRKDAFYLYKAAWNKEEPFVHLCGSRYVDRTEEETEIKVYSNQNEVTLLMDGKTVATEKGNRVFVFKVLLTGEHRITAIAGSCKDSMLLRKSDKQNAGYRLASSNGVTNWFDEEGFDSSCFSIRDTLGTLMQHPATAKIVGALMERAAASRGDVAKSAGGNANLQRMMAGMSLQSLIKQAGESAIPPEAVKQLNAALQKIKK
ncbi:MAG: glycoside hydrolase family 2 protein [Lachnospiraceae bacterium]|nr:glycoside hydrolase family 2 protein [Lachnospiraceae bacterium]